MTISLSLVYGQQQYFRVQPRDVKVQEGGEAMLECEVANLGGQVQWTKDGFALGNKFNISFHFLFLFADKSEVDKFPCIIHSLLIHLGVIIPKPNNKFASWKEAFAELLQSSFVKIGETARRAARAKLAFHKLKSAEIYSHDFVS